MGCCKQYPNKKRPPLKKISWYVQRLYKDQTSFGVFTNAFQEKEFEIGYFDIHFFFVYFSVTWERWTTKEVTVGERGVW